MKLVHHSPLGALEIAGVLGRPEPGEPFDVDDDIAETLLEQGELFAPAPDGDLTLPKLRDLAAERGVDIKGLRTKKDIAEAISNHHEAPPPPDQEPVTEPIQEAAQQVAAADEADADTKETDQ